MKAFLNPTKSAHPPNSPICRTISHPGLTSLSFQNKTFELKSMWFLSLTIAFVCSFSLPQLRPPLPLIWPTQLPLPGLPAVLTNPKHCQLNPLKALSGWQGVHVLKPTITENLLQSFQYGDKH